MQRRTLWLIVFLSLLPGALFLLLRRTRGGPSGVAEFQIEAAESTPANASASAKPTGGAIAIDPTSTPKLVATAIASSAVAPSAAPSPSVSASAAPSTSASSR